jgi:hypothetical protein
MIKYSLKYSKKGVEVKIREGLRSIFRLTRDRINETNLVLEGVGEVQLAADIKNVYVYAYYTEQPLILSATNQEALLEKENVRVRRRVNLLEKKIKPKKKRPRVLILTKGIKRRSIQIFLDNGSNSPQIVWMSSFRSGFVYVPPTQAAVEEGQFVKIHSLVALEPKKFSISGNGEEDLDLYNTFLLLRAKITLLNGDNLPPNTFVAPVNYYMLIYFYKSTFFKRYINHTQWEHLPL